MAAQLKAEWQNFVTCTHYDFTVFRAGVELYTAQIGGELTSQEFFAADYPGITYAAHVVPINAPIPCAISEVDEGGEGA